MFSFIKHTYPSFPARGSQHQGNGRKIYWITKENNDKNDDDDNNNNNNNNNNNKSDLYSKKCVKSSLIFDLFKFNPLNVFLGERKMMGLEKPTKKIK